MLMLPFDPSRMQVKGNMTLAMKFNNVLTATRKQFEAGKGTSHPLPTSLGPMTRSFLAASSV